MPRARTLARLSHRADPHRPRRPRGRLGLGNDFSFPTDLRSGALRRLGHRAPRPAEFDVYARERTLLAR